VLHQCEQALITNRFISHLRADERVLIAEVVARAHASEHFAEVAIALGQLHQVADDFSQRGRERVRPNERDLRASVLEHRCSNRVALSRVRVEQVSSTQRRREFPTEIRRVDDAEIQTLAAKRRMHVRCVAREKHAAFAIRRGLSRIVSPPGGVLHREHFHVGAAHSLNRTFNFTQRDGRVPVQRRAIELSGEHAPIRRREEPVRRAMPTRGNLLGSVEFNERHVAGDGRVSAGEIEADEFANVAPATVTADEILRLQRPGVRLHRHSVCVLLNAFDGDSALNLDAEFQRARGENTFQRFLRKKPRTTCRVALQFLIDEEQRREMATRFLHGVRAESRLQHRGARAHRA
jgi:hypothetical protein